MSSVCPEGRAIARIRPVRLLCLQLVCFLAVVSVSRRAASDVVYLEGGRSLEGEARPAEPDGTVEIRLGGGAAVRVKQSEILRIERKPSAMQLFDAGFEARPEGEIEPLVDLLVLAREKGLRRRARKAAEEILKIDANHELARWTLGYVVFRNRWVLDKQLRAKGDLVRVDGQWMTKAEQKRRQQEEARHEVEELLGLVESENARIRTYAVKEIRRRVESRDPVAIEVLGDRLSDRRVAVRLVAAVQLGCVRAGRGEKSFRADRIAGQLHRMALREESREVRRVLHGGGGRQGTLATFYPAETFRLALEASADDPREVERLADILTTAVRKAWVPDLCRAAAEETSGAAARLALRRILGVDLGTDSGAWLKHWESRKDEFQDVE